LRVKACETKKGGKIRETFRPKRGFKYQGVDYGREEKIFRSNSS
jgi:hypothetical protein